MTHHLAASLIRYRVLHEARRVSRGEFRARVLLTAHPTGMVVGTVLAWGLSGWVFANAPVSAESPFALLNRSLVLVSALAFLVVATDLLSESVKAPDRQLVTASPVPAADELCYRLVVGLARSLHALPALFVIPLYFLLH